jgi:hypothetical protein
MGSSYASARRPKTKRHHLGAFPEVSGHLHVKEGFNVPFDHHGASLTHRVIELPASDIVYMPEDFIPQRAMQKVHG